MATAAKKAKITDDQELKDLEKMNQEAVEIWLLLLQPQLIQPLVMKFFLNFSGSKSCCFSQIN